MLKVICFIIILISQQLYSYDKIELIEEIDDLRIHRQLSKEYFLNDSIVVLLYHFSSDTNDILNYVSSSFSSPYLANYNLNTKDIEFFYIDTVTPVTNNIYGDAFLSKSRDKLLARLETQSTELDSNLFKNFEDSIAVFNTIDGSKDSNFRIPNYKMGHFKQMYNDNISFLAYTDNNSNTMSFKYEFYIGELDLDNYSYTLTRTPERYDELKFLGTHLVDSLPKEIILDFELNKDYKGHDKEIIFSIYNSLVDVSYLEAFPLDDSLRYRKTNENYWQIAGSLTEWNYNYKLNNDSIFVKGSVYKNWRYAYEKDYFDEDLKSTILGADDQNYNMFVYRSDYTKNPTERFIEIYNYKIKQALDSLQINQNLYDHPIEDIGRIRTIKNMRVYNDSLCVLILAGTIYKYKLTSHLDIQRIESNIKKIYPNPSNGEFIVELSDSYINLSKKDLSIFDLNGNIIDNYNYSIYGNSLIISLTNSISNNLFLNVKNEVHLINIMR